jgi:hypothetical protein
VQKQDLFSWLGESQWNKLTNKQTQYLSKAFRSFVVSQTCIGTKLVMRCKTNETMKQNEQKKSKIKEQKGKNVVSNQQSPQRLKIFVLPHLCNFHNFFTFHQCRGNGAKDENPSSATLTQRRLQSSKTTYLLVVHRALYLPCSLKKI